MPRRKTQEEFELEVLEKIGPDYKVLGTYVNKDTKIEMIHYICGNIFLKRPHDVTSKNSGCPYCNGNKKALYNENWVKNNTPYPYKYVKDYSKMSEKCVFYCEECNTEFLQTPSRIINEHIYGCNCYKTKKKTHNDFLNDLGNECLKEYDVLDEYINADTKIKFLHKKCNTIFELSPYSFIHKAKKQYCPICYYKKSKGEIEISKYLSSNDIIYHREFIFPNDNKRFDFFIPSYNIAIEYDGQQHFEPNEFFGGVEEFNKTKQRDKEKNKYCLQNNIKLFRIPYYDYDNINQILHEIFKEKSPTTIEKYIVTE